MTTILIVDDEKNIRTTLRTTFELEGYRVAMAEDGAAALEAVDREAVDLVLLDLQMPGIDGFETLRRLRQAGHEVPVVFLSAHGTIGRAVEAVRLGAFDFVEKPPHADKLLLVARNALRQVELEEENRELRDERREQYDMIGSTPPMRELFEQIRRAAPTDARVLVLGENGTGKELIARALHTHSPRSSRAFVRVNCAAIPRELFESELFGHERGAFTGATTRRRGKFVRADGGTLFLDEIGEMPSELQAKLLRALESGEVEPVGAEREVRVDARVIAATNRDLDADVAAGRFRQDLYYRLQVVTLRAPALRERTEDISALAERFLRQSCADSNCSKRFSPAALERLARHPWPGNVRELRNLVERLVILCREETLDVGQVERNLSGVPGRDPEEPSGAPVLGESLRETMAQVERRLLRETLESCRWRMTAAAERLGLERSHLYRKLKALGIERPD